MAVGGVADLLVAAQVMMMMMSTCLVALQQVPEAQIPPHLMTVRNLIFLPSMSCVPALWEGSLDDLNFRAFGRGVLAALQGGPSLKVARSVSTVQGRPLKMCVLRTCTMPCV